MTRSRMGWPEAIMFATLFCSLAGTAVAVVSIVLKHRRIVAGVEPADADA